MITFERLQLVKEMIIQLVVYQTIPISLDDDPKTNKLILQEIQNKMEIQMFFIIKEAKETILNLS